MLSLLGVDLLTRIMQVNVIVGICLAILGIAISGLATRIARAIRRTRNVSPNDKIILVLKAIGLMLIVVALIVLVIQ